MKSDSAGAPRIAPARSRQDIDRLIRGLEARRKNPAPPAITARPRDRDAYPLSFAQERLWFLDRLAPGRATYNVPAAMDLRGPLDPRVLERAFDAVVGQNEALRTTFREEDGKPVQVVAEAAARPLERVDLSTFPAAERAGRSDALAAAEAARPFDLSRGPLFRHALHRFGPDHHRLILNLHHIVTDGWSLRLMIAEWAAHYQALTRGRAPIMDPPPVQAIDHALWQREHLATDGTRERHLSYWRQALDGMPTVLALPAERPRPALPSGRGGVVPLALCAESMTPLLRALAREAGTTVFSLLLAAFGAFLHRVTGARDLGVGTPVAGRTRVEVERTVGLFVNTVVLRLRPRGHHTLRHLATQAQRTTIEALEHQELPFEIVVDDLAPDRDLGRTPLFQVLFALQEDPATGASLDDLTLTHEPLHSGTAKVDLSLELFDHGARLSGWLGYSSDLFDRPAAERMAAQWHRFLADAVARPDTAVAALELLPEDQRAALESFNRTATPSSDVRLDTLIAEQAALSPDAVAVVFEHRSLSYRALVAAAGRLAARLRRHGVGPDVLVGVCAERSLELVVALLAVLRAGGGFVPLDPSYPRRRLADMIADAGADMLLVQEHVRASLPDDGAEILLIDGVADSAADGADEDGEPLSEAVTSPDHLAYTLFTSGSTGKPKGAMNSHRAIVNRLMWMRQVYALGADDRLLQKTPISFDVSVWELFAPLIAGARLVLARPEGHKDSDYLSRLIADQGITVLHFVPSMLRAFLAEPSLEARCRSLRQVVASGEALPFDLQEGFFARLPHVALDNLYGPTEAAVEVTAWRCVPGDPRGTVPIGRPIANVRMHVLDPGLRRLPVGAPGQLMIGGVQVARGYRRRPALTAAAFVPDPFAEHPGDRLYATGDLARWHSDGTLTFLGRIDHQVKIRGHRIELGEIEATLLTHPSVAEAVVVARAGRAGDPRLVAYVIGAADSADDGVLRTHLRESLPEAMVPTTFVALEALPLHPNGKVDRKALPAPPDEHPKAAFVAPETPEAVAIAGIWREVLGTPRVGTGDSFFELGGHSLLATQVMARLRTVCQVDLPLRTLFESPRLGDLADAVRLARAAGKDAGPPIEPLPAALRAAGPLEASFAQERMWLLHRLSGNRMAGEYTIAVAADLEGLLDRDALAQALAGVVARHEALRTTFVEQDGRPQQRIHPAIDLDLRVVDLSHADDPAALATSKAETLARLPFDLEAGPLLRAALYRLGEASHRMVLAVHHIVADGWSLDVLLGEIVALYREYMTGDAAALAPLPVQVADVAAWQRSWLDGPVRDTQLAYWREQLRDLPTLELPTDRPRPAVRSGAGFTVEDHLPTAIAEPLDALARDRGVTRFMALLTLFQVLLARTSGQRDFAVGAPIANRRHPEVEPLIGFFVNTLVLRADLDGSSSFDALLDRVRATCVDAYAHQDLPFEHLVSALEPARDPSRTPLFQAMLAVADAPREPTAITDRLTLTPHQVDTGTAKTDVVLTVVPSDAGWRLGLEVSADLFEQATARRMLGHFRHLVAAAVNAPDQPVHRLELMDTAERAQLAALRARLAPYPRTSSIADVVEAWATRTPDAIALSESSVTLTYRQLDRRANALAHRLRGAGVTDETAVALIVDRSISHIVATLAVLKAGGAYVPLDPAFPAARSRLMIEAAAVRVAIAGEAHRGAVSRLGALDTLWLPSGPVTDDPVADTPPGRRTGPDHVAYIMFTSGSSGIPKGVAVTHRGVVRLVVNNDALDLGPDETLLHYAPATFDAATLEMWGALLNGGRLAVVPSGPASLAQLGETIVAQAVTTLFLTAGLFHQMVESQGDSLANLRQLISGGDVLLPTAVRRATEILTKGRMINCYGPTESAVVATSRAFRSPGEVAAPVPIGRPIANTGMVVVDRDLWPVPTGVPGELCLLGDGLARGYVGRPKRTALAFVPDPTATEADAGGRMYRTGDRVRLRGDGDLDFLGRLDHQVKIRGFRIEPGEVETALRALPTVDRAAVIVRDDPVAGKRLIAFTVSGSTADELRRALADRLPPFMVPSFFVGLDAMPLTDHGKVDRASLEAWQLATAVSDDRPPETPTEKRIATLFTELLGIELPGRGADFFALGGHSLLATRLMSRLRTAFGVELPLDVVFAHPTVAGLAAALDAALDAGAGAPDPTELPLIALSVPQGTPRPLSPAQERLWLLDRFEPGSAAYNIPTSIRLRGPLDATVLAASLRETVRRHQVLRTVYASDDGRPVQRVGPVPERVLEIDDRRGLDPAEHPAVIAAVQAGEAGQAFDLAAGPVFRARLLRLADEDHVLLFTVHHIAGDGWSVGVLVGELGVLYQAFSRGAASPLDEPTLQYADFAGWQRRWLESGHRDRQLAYWQSKLDGVPPGLDLPTDRPRPAVRGFRGGRSVATVPRELATRLRRLAETHDATLFMVLLTGWKVLLARLSGETDVVVGAPVAGRRRQEVEGLFGMFLNSLVLRTDLGGDPSFEALIGRVRATALEAFAHQDVPFETLLEALKPPRDLSRTPFFQVFFNMVNLDLPALEWPGVVSEHLSPVEMPAKFDLTLYVEEPADGSLRFDMVRNADLIGDLRGAEMLRQYLALLDQASADPAQPIDRLSLRTEAAREVLPDPAAPLADTFVGSVPDRFRAQVERAPQQLAVIASDGTSWTYRELDRQSNRLARALHAGGLDSGQVVAIYAHRSPTLVWTVLGVLKAGGAFLLLDPDYPALRLVDLLRRAAPAAFLSLETAGEPDPAVVAHLAQAGCPVLSLPAWTECGNANDPLAEMPDDDPMIAVGPDDLAYLAFTSGSTGTPKGILGRHGPLTHFLPWQAERFGLGADDRYSLLSGLAHDPLHRDLFTPLCLGSTICVPDPAAMLVPGRIAGWMARQRVTIAHLTPAMGQLLTDTGSTPVPTLPTLRFVFLVGDVLSRADVGRIAHLAPSVTVVNYFGTTETQRAVAFHAIPAEQARRTGSDPTQQILPLGHGMQDVQLLVLDPRGAQAGIGELGEICVRSPHLAAGYLSDPARTAERFVTHQAADGPGDRVYRTGDLGRYLPDGDVAFAGRMDDQIQIRGFRVELGEVEAQLTAITGVHQAAVLALGEGAERRLIAHITPERGSVLDQDALRGSLAAWLPAYMVPSAFVVHKELPMTPNGKVDRRALAHSGTDSEPQKRTSGGGARTPAERQLVALLREILEQDSVHVEDNFFELGANSLLLARLHERLERMRGQSIAMIDLFNHPTVRSLAGHLDQHQRPPRSRAENDRWMEQLKRGRSRQRRRAERGAS